MGRCGGLQGTEFSTVSMLGGCGCLVRTDLYQFLLKEGVAVMKELISTVSTIGGCCGLKITDF